MEFLVVLVVIVVICKILGVSNLTLVMGGLLLAELMIFAMLLFFIYANIHLLFSKKKTAMYVRCDTPEKSRFKVAYYRVDGEEYPCIFPKEAAFNKLLYRTDRECSVRLSKRLKKVFDRWAAMTCVIGLLSSIAAVIFTLSLFNGSGFFF